MRTVPFDTRAHKLVFWATQLTLESVPYVTRGEIRRNTKRRIRCLYGGDVKARDNGC
jgi:hypothetical protein